MSLADPSLDNNDGANWCEASSSYGVGDLGTPGAANDCTSDVGGEVVKIHEVQGNSETSPLVGSTVVIEGIA